MLLDSNILIYASKPGYDVVRQFLAASKDEYFHASYISKLCFMHKRQE
jgi:hypothetical protein